jgi:hypothetical protein
VTRPKLFERLFFSRRYFSLVQRLRFQRVTLRVTLRGTQRTRALLVRHGAALAHKLFFER